MIDVSTISLIQSDLLGHMGDAFSKIAGYGLDLLYFFAILEVALFGLLWMMQQDGQWGELVTKIIKIGLIFFIVQNSAYIFGLITDSFAQMAGLLSSTPGVGGFIFNPAHLWQFGYNVGVALLQSAATGNAGIGLALIQIILGMGILLAFAFLGMQIVLQLTAFYLTALLSLIFLPIGVFSATTNMFGQAITAVLRAGVRVLVIIFIVGIAVTTWRAFGLTKLTTSPTINVALGLLITAWLFSYLAACLPKMVAGVVGQLLAHPATRGSAVSYAASQSFATGSSPNLLSVQAASTIQPGVGGMQSAAAISGVQAAAAMNASGISVQVSSAGGGQGASNLDKLRAKSGLSDASVLNKSISEETMGKLRNTFTQVLKEQQVRVDR